MQETWNWLDLLVVFTDTCFAILNIFFTSAPGRLCAVNILAFHRSFTPLAFVGMAGRQNI